MLLRPQFKDLKKQREFYSGKKKRHTIKTQVVVNKTLQQIFCTSFSNAKKQDFRLFNESNVRLAPNQTVLTDTGYQGLAKIHRQISIPKKEPKAALNC